MRDRTSLEPASRPPSRSFDEACTGTRGEGLRARAIDTVQVNIGLTCNLACHHCHVVSGPERKEQMARGTMERVLALAEAAGAETLDVTGGAPEMMPHFRWFVQEARRIGLHVMVRTNLTILLEPGYEDLPSFLADEGVHLVASLPCYLPENVDRQRGRGVYVRSIEALRRLGALGYGTSDDLPLDLIYNPLGPHLPPSQGELERAYRRTLAEEYGIRFTRLLALTNMAIGRFLRDLERQGRAEDYMRLLRESFNPATLDDLMCRHQIHVAYDGTLYDCDFNYALGVPCRTASGGVRSPPTVWDMDVDALHGRRIATARHCFGCTAGAGSSCGGALV
jgi:radical SAM/Cys-rich protein